MRMIAGPSLATVRAEIAAGSARGEALARHLREHGATPADPHRLARLIQAYRQALAESRATDRELQEARAADRQNTTPNLARKRMTRAEMRTAEEFHKRS